MRKLIITFIAVLLLPVAGCGSWIGKNLPFRFGDTLDEGSWFDSTRVYDDGYGTLHVFFENGDFLHYYRYDDGYEVADWGTYLKKDNTVWYCMIGQYQNLFYKTWLMRQYEMIVEDSSMRLFYVDKKDYAKAVETGNYSIYDTITDPVPFVLKDTVVNFTADSSYVRQIKKMWKDKRQWKEWTKRNGDKKKIPLK